MTGDRYAGEFPREQFRKCGISYEVSAQAKSDIYVNFLPLLNSRKVELLDHPRLISQLTGLERRTSRAGKDSIDHAPGGHDDVANAAAGVLTLAQRPVQHLRMFTLADGCTGDFSPGRDRRRHRPTHATAHAHQVGQLRRAGPRFEIPLKRMKGECHEATN